MKTFEQELIKAAAEVYGFGSKDKNTGELQFIWTETEYPRGSGQYGALWNYVGHGETAQLWNPLSCGDDALRLAGKLHLIIDIGPISTSVHESNGRRDIGFAWHCFDEASATRLAITIAGTKARCFDEYESPDIKTIHSEVLNLKCDSNANQDKQFGFLAGIHAAAATISKFIKRS